MNDLGLLKHIFVESTGSASIIPFISSITLEAMKLLGGYALLGWPLIIAFFGIILGCMLNYVIGTALCLVRKNVAFLGSSAFPKSEAFFRRYGWALCAFYWMPLGSILLVIAGFLRAPLPKVMLAAAIGAAIHLTLFML